MDEKELKLRYDIILAGWRLMRENSKIQDTDEYWDTLIKVADGVVNEFKGHRFAHEMVYIVLAELNNIAAKKKELVTKEEYGKVIARQMELWKRFNTELQKEGD